jgi:hypothetical protein
MPVTRHMRFLDPVGNGQEVWRHEMRIKEDEFLLPPVNLLMHP